jgi:hypothetical protein
VASLARLFVIYLDYSSINVNNKQPETMNQTSLRKSAGSHSFNIFRAGDQKILRTGGSAGLQTLRYGHENDRNLTQTNTQIFYVKDRFFNRINY